MNVTYIVEESLVDADKELPVGILFGGNQTWQQRDESFILKPSMKVHCGFAQTGGPELFSPKDHAFGSRCRFLVATGIFDNYDQPHQPSNVSLLAQELFCFAMLVDHVSLESFKHGGLLSHDEYGGKWVGMWRVLELKSLPYNEPRRNGKVPKLLLHRLFPEARYSVWIDGKLELVTDPILILERYLWRENQSFAIAQHKHHRSVYEEADACKRRKRYARPLIDKHMEVYRNEGLQPWSEAKLPVQSDVPEGALIVREHTPMTNLFSCLWFNEVNRFTPRDQLSFGYVVHRLDYSFPFFMFPNCEYNTLVVLHKHVREHSSKLEWAKRMDELPEHLARPYSSFSAPSPGT
ncbi:hypothetical protein M758_10G181500 [Ceratodon purpureus]|nr:hypothetical protein M758_10G181500 [Ceratodon purpureus]